jgi:hypothetical protein
VQLDCQIMFDNPTRKPVRGAVAIASDTAARQ